VNGTQKFFVVFIASLFSFFGDLLRGIIR
jgi:hypothetical protein